MIHVKKFSVPYLDSQEEMQSNEYFFKKYFADLNFQYTKITMETILYPVLSEETDRLSENLKNPLGLFVYVYFPGTNADYVIVVKFSSGHYGVKWDL